MGWACNTAVFMTCLGGLSEMGQKFVSTLLSGESPDQVSTSLLSSRLLQLTKKEMNSNLRDQKIRDFVDNLKT